jgi:hypothetical protein
MNLTSDLHLMAGQRFLVPLPFCGAALVALRGREPVQVEAVENAHTPDVLICTSVVGLEVYADLRGAEV